VKEKLLREDLFYRLSVIPIYIPPLRERRPDIPLLAQHFLERFRREMASPVTKISSDAMARLERYGWPGNVRELENVIERAVALETTPEILPERLPESLLAIEDRPVPQTLREGFHLDDYLLSVEADLVRRALDQASGDRGTTSKLLGINARALRYLIAKHGLAERGAKS
jgi:two-component system response regulator PilR (NtrC family)